MNPLGLPFVGIGLLFVLFPERIARERLRGATDPEPTPAAVRGVRGVGGPLLVAVGALILLSCGRREPEGDGADANVEAPWLRTPPVRTLSADFDDEVAVVTGGSSGIGRAVARRFGEAGATVLVADVREAPKRDDESTPTHEAIREEGGEAEYVATDVADPGAIASVVEAARDYGGVSVMVNNAGVHRNLRFLDVEPAEFDRVLGVNARGVYFGTQAAARDMLDREEPGVVVNTASTTSRVAEWTHSHYAASKGAVEMITRSAALELAPEGIRVNAVAPGPVATEITEGWFERAAGEIDAAGEQPSLPVRAGEPDDLPGAYLFLASDWASYVTGETLWVDGGTHAN